MKNPFRAIALDYDGTLTQSTRPASDVLEAIAAARSTGMKIILVTGRVLGDLFSDFPDAVTTFDAIVAENGLVVWSENNGFRLLAPPVSPALEEALRARDVFVTRGSVLLATDARFDGIILDEISKLGLDCQIVRNRGALMIVPAGTSKGSGVNEALGELAISPHSVVAFGDAENDHSLLEACEIGVAVANAIPSLKAHADVVLKETNGRGIAQFIRDLVHGSLAPVTPKRWRVPIGTRDDGSAVTLPASGINVLIAGGTGCGKSYLAGLFAERLLQLGYSVCVFDPEGDHTQLGHLRGTVTLGGTDGVPTPTQLGRLLHRRFGGAVVDLSLLRPDERMEYTKAALHELEERRATTGLPHWIFLDEAHATLGPVEGVKQAIDLDEKGYCLVTYHPTALCPEALHSADILFLLPQSVDIASALLTKMRTTRTELDVDPWIDAAKALKEGQALMLDLRDTHTAAILTLSRRRSAHVRHRHKYANGFLPPRSHFLFRDGDALTGRYAANLEDFHREIQTAPDSVLAHHAGNSDFSRWIAEVLRDHKFASQITELECKTSDLAILRKGLVDAIEHRYADEEATSSVPTQSVATVAPPPVTA